MKKNALFSLFPILFGYFVMGFVDIVGIATNYVKKDFELSDTLANLIPMMVFLWFAVCSIPIGIFMGKIGRRNTVLLSMVMTTVSMLLPILYYNFSCILIAFTILGISNTVLQVSLNPMVTLVVNKDKIASVLTLGQFIKAMSAFLGPIIISLAVTNAGSWKLIFPIYAIISILAAIWLLFSVKADCLNLKESTTFKSTLVLFSDRRIVVMFIGILAIVGVDVGLNTSIPKLLMEQTGLNLSKAGLGTSLYFVSRTIGTFIGAFLLTHFSGTRFMRFCMIVSIISFVIIPFVHQLYLLLILIIVIGLLCSNIFSIIFSYALQYKPHQSNEISSLMIMGVSGGGLVMPFMGVLSDSLGQVMGIFPLLVCIIYLLWASNKLT